MTSLPTPVVKLILAALLAVLTASSALAFTSLDGGFGKLGARGRGKAVPAPTGDILLVDGVSFILQTDGTSLICRAGGC